MGRHHGCIPVIPARCTTTQSPEIKTTPASAFLAQGLSEMSQRAPSPKAASAGTVPSPNAAMAAAPVSALPVATASPSAA